MSKHWHPGRKVPRIPRVRGRRRLRPARGGNPWARIETYLGETRRTWPRGASAGLVLFAAACVGVTTGIYWAGAPFEPVAREARVASGDRQVVAESQETDVADAEWQRRATAGGVTASGEAAQQSGAAGATVAFGASPSTRSGQSFHSCKWGGGTNCVVDGDTIYLDGRKIRIAGIDAPETHDYGCGSELALGERAAARLRELVNSGALSLSSIDRDEDVYGRKLRNVAVDGRDVGDVLVGEGLARPYGGGRRGWC